MNFCGALWSSSDHERAQWDSAYIVIAYPSSPKLDRIQQNSAKLDHAQQSSVDFGRVRRRSVVEGGARWSFGGHWCKVEDSRALRVSAEVSSGRWSLAEFAGAHWSSAKLNEPRRHSMVVTCPPSHLFSFT